MKNTIKSLAALLLCGTALLSCKKDDADNGKLEVDLTSISEVAAQNPADVSVALTSNVNWILTTPEWVTPSATYGSGDAILTFSFRSNYKDETTTVPSRSGEIRISGGGSLNGKGHVVIIPVKQLGHTYVDPNPSLGGITDAGEFADFIKAANSGGSLKRWSDESGNVLLLDDIDISGQNIDWQSIADETNATNGNNGCTLKGTPFTGVFDGCDHKISGFNPEVKLGANKTFGLFAAVNQAVIKNLELDGTMKISAADQSDAGMLVGTALNSTIENVKVSGKLVSKGTTASKRFSLGGICGYACASDNLGTVIKGCTSDIDVEAVGGSNTANGATCAMYGGIAGFCTTPKALEGHLCVTIENCMNNGDMNVTLGRCSGIAATANAGTILKDCTNNGNQVNKIANGRLGSIVCNLAYNSKVVNCVNNGDLDATLEGYNGTVAGLVALMGDATCSLEGGGNYGTVKAVSTSKQYIGLLVANFSNFSYVKDVVVSGSIVVDGVKREINASNYMENIGCVKTGFESRISGLTWVAPKN